MQIIVQEPVFNRQLKGKAVRVVGFDVDGDKWNNLFLVKDVNGEMIYLVAFTGKVVSFHIEDFESEVGLKMTVIEEELTNGN
ncbi:hypothetical protein [Ectobacillus antri]|jgi:hypothetical protein|uniref:hypothetical protein n=1 Tax=Ectobacillus antri TaxID=2486280 RepID=UPI000F59A8B1|nr:hypothetical protein [Ectobacillus antri]